MLDNVRIGASGLAAASAGFNATAQNVANVRTPGFGRRSVRQSIADPITDGRVRLGRGVIVNAIQRSEAGLLGVRIVDAAGDSAHSRTLRDSLAEVESLFDESTSAGPRTSLSAFFDAVSLASADASDPGVRSSIVQATDDVAYSVERLARGLDQIRSQLQEQLELELPPLSQKLQRVAMLNQQLIAAGGAAQAPDVADQLNRLLRELGEDGGFAGTVASDGTAHLMLQGHAVATEIDAQQLTLSAPNQVQVAIDGGAASVELGGRLGAVAEAYDRVTGYLDQLNAFASSFADAVNAANAAGFDQDGAAGGALLSYDPANAAASLRLATGVTGRSVALSSSPGATGNAANVASFLDLETTLDPGTALATLTNDVATDTATAITRADRDELVLADLDALNESLHGVDLDEEAINLTTYQTAYQASARVLNVADNLLGTLMELA